jgi:hypothetical protein
MQANVGFTYTETLKSIFHAPLECAVEFWSHAVLLFLYEFKFLKAETEQRADGSVMDIAALAVHHSESRSTLCQVNKSSPLISLYLISERKRLHDTLMMVIKRERIGNGKGIHFWTCTWHHLYGLDPSEGLLRQGPNM